MAAKPAGRPQPRLYLATPPLDTAEAFASKLADTINGIDVAAVLLRLAPGDDASLLRIVAAMAPTVQKSGAALLLDGHPDIAARCGVDGVHLSNPTALKSAISTFKPDRIVGAGQLPARHDAMVAGEAGADYVLFGEPDRNGARPSTEAILDRVAWWAEVFEPPCVAYAATIEEARNFAAAGADFVLVGDLVWNDPRGARIALMDAAAAIGQT
jgi:thiamine-phosphate pyrophosphorylase